MEWRLLRLTEIQDWRDSKQGEGGWRRKRRSKVGEGWEGEGGREKDGAGRAQRTHVL